MANASSATSFRQGVMIILRDGTKYLLIHKPGRDQNEWYFPAGGIDDGETAEQTFVREINEELHLKPADVIIEKISKIHHKYEWNEEFRKKTGFCGQEQTIIIARLKNPNSIKIDAKEIDGFKFVEGSQLLDAIPHKDLNNTIKKLRETGDI